MIFFGQCPTQNVALRCENTVPKTQPDHTSMTALVLQSAMERFPMHLGRVLHELFMPLLKLMFAETI